MSSSSEGTSFYQFKYCDLCRISHKQGRKHVYARRHKEICKNILEKFRKKIYSAKEMLSNPVIHDAVWENGAKFWCYFCKGEFDKHMTQESETISNAGLLQHLCLESHFDHANDFFSDNHLDHKEKKKFLLDEQKYAEFIIASEARRTQFKEGKLRDILEESQKIRQHERKRQWIIQTKMEKLAKMGNVHSGATPPWMTQDAEDTTESKVIGPTMDDLTKEREGQKKRKLPATRVGAKFDRNTKSDASWLPSFGRVWSKNRRDHSRKTFIKSGSVRIQEYPASEASYAQSMDTLDSNSHTGYAPISSPSTCQTRDTSYCGNSSQGYYNRAVTHGKQFQNYQESNYQSTTYNSEGHTTQRSDIRNQHTGRTTNASNNGHVHPSTDNISEPIKTNAPTMRRINISSNLL